MITIKECQDCNICDYHQGQLDVLREQLEELRGEMRDSK